MNFSLGLSAWRDERSIADALTHHDRGGLAVAVSLAVSLAASLLKGSKYGQYAAFLDADTVTTVGVVVAGGIAGFGHWATGGALASAAGQLAAPVPGPTGVGVAVGVAYPAAPVGSGTANPGQPGTLRDVVDPTDRAGG